MATNRRTIVKLVLLGSAVATALVYLVVVPGMLAVDEGRVLAYLVIGWIPYTLVFYGLGRLVATPEKLPTMRPADVGLALFLLSLLISLGLDAWGFTPERVPEGHALQAIGIYLGLALFGWGIGRRSTAIEGIIRDRSG